MMECVYCHEVLEDDTAAMGHTETCPERSTTTRMFAGGMDQEDKKESRMNEQQFEKFKQFVKYVEELKTEANAPDKYNSWGLVNLACVTGERTWVTLDVLKEIEKFLEEYSYLIIGGIE